MAGNLKVTSGGELKASCIYVLTVSSEGTGQHISHLTSKTSLLQLYSIPSWWNLVFQERKWYYRCLICITFPRQFKTMSQKYRPGEDDKNWVMSEKEKKNPVF